MRKTDDYIKEKTDRNPELHDSLDMAFRKAQIIKKIIQYRIDKNLSQTQLAHEIGVSQQYISKIEEGEFSNLLTVENILNHIGYHLKLEIVRIRRKLTTKRISKRKSLISA